MDDKDRATVGNLEEEASGFDIGCVAAGERNHPPGIEIPNVGHRHSTRKLKE